ncbi:MAG: V-type ATP synthase subunit C [Clostridiales bacterium]|uniref:V-type ATP synthase subunit C n=1 Tax=Clostridium sp. N3C TaxID=1776758 RepID=UPI00092DEFD7|nr:V-type ATP synthase subunit C [Clostridium sp. N3C]NLZ49679.1 V-type ATP synthase subunit C [Clostridiales bacterium]SCN21657.1 V-type sodium pump subunit C [Clostridium sp. N3C]
MNNMVFTSVIPRLRVLETRLLDRSKLDRMIDSNSPLDAVKVLQESEYAAHMSHVKRAEDYEEMLSSELKRIYKLMYEISPEKSVVDVMSVRYDYHNIKVLLKAKALKQDFSHLLLPIGMVEVDKLKAAVLNESYSDLPQTMRSAIEEIERDFINTKDPQRIDIIADRYMFKHMLDIAIGIENRFVEKYVKSLIDLTNVKSLIRVKKQNKDRKFLEEVLIEGGNTDKDNFISLLMDNIETIAGKLSYVDYIEPLRLGVEDYIKTGSLNGLEKFTDDYIVKIMKDAKYVSFGPEPLIAYIFAKENEIKLIRMIMVGKINGMDAGVIRERLRDNYV